MVHTGTTKVAAKQEIASQKIPKAICVWTVESDESTRPRVESSPLTIHEDRITGKGFTSMTCYNLVHKFILLLEAMEISDAKAACSGQRMEKARDNSNMAIGKSRVRKMWYSKLKQKKRKSTLLHWWTFCHHQNTELVLQVAKIQWQSRAPCWNCNRRLWDLRSFYWTGFVGVQHDCRKSDGMLLRDCQIVTDKQPTQCQLTLNWNWRTLPDCSKFESQDVQTCGKIRFSRQRWPTSWANIEDPVVPLERNLCGHPVGGLWWERQFEDMFLDLGWWRSTNLGVSVCSSNTRTIFYRCTRMTQTCPERRRIWLRKRWMKNVDLDEPTSFLDHIYLGCAQRECKQNDIIIEEWTKMLESRISAGATEKLPRRKKPHAKTAAWSYDM